MQTKYRVELTFEEPLLGTASQDPDVYAKFIGSKAPEDNGEGELETLDFDSEMEKGTTGFHRLNGEPMVYDYQIKGFMKDACSMLRRDKDTLSSKLAAYRKIIDGMVFVFPRRIPIRMVAPVDFLTRPIRAATAQGERIALARSESVAEGSGLSLEILVLGDLVTEAVLNEWFTYGALRGLGQWRNSGMGRLSYHMERLTTE